ncbi:MAG: MFS transporter [Vicinamibacteraceae bacterium]
MTTMVAKPPCDDGQILSGPLVIACDPVVGRWVMTATILGSSMAFIDSSAVNVALPVLQSSLGASMTQVQWIIEVYMLFLSALILVGGALGDRLGHRRVFMWGVAAFAVASLWCGLAPDPTQLIIARAAQGIGGALLVPGSLAIISASFDKSSRGKAIGTWSGATAITAAAGPVLGGWLASTFSWRWVFLLNIPFAVVVLLIAATRVPETRDLSAGTGTPGMGGIDWLGAGLSVVGLGLLVYGLVESANLGLAHPIALGAMIAGIVVLGIFVWVEGQARAPMMPLDVFASRSFTGANLLTVLLYGALGGALFFLPFNLVQVQGYTPVQAGAAWLPFILAIAFLSRWTGALVPIVGARLLLVVGPLLTATGFALAVRPGTDGSYWTTFFPAFLVMGLGMAIAVAPLVTVVMGSVESDRAGVASGINNAVSRAAGLLALAVMGLLVVGTFNSALDERLAALNVAPHVVEQLAEQRINLAAAEPPASASPAMARALRKAIDESFVVGFRAAMWSGAVLAAASALVAWLMIGEVRPPRAAG